MFVQLKNIKIIDNTPSNISICFTGDLYVGDQLALRVFNLGCDANHEYVTLDGEFIHFTSDQLIHDQIKSLVPLTKVNDHGDGFESSEWYLSDLDKGVTDIVVKRSNDKFLVAIVFQDNLHFVETYGMKPVTEKDYHDLTEKCLKTPFGPGLGNAWEEAEMDQSDLARHFEFGCVFVDYDIGRKIEKGYEIGVTYNHDYMATILSFVCVQFGENVMYGREGREDL